MRSLLVREKVRGAPGPICSAWEGVWEGRVGGQSTLT